MGTDVGSLNFPFYNKNWSQYSNSTVTVLFFPTPLASTYLDNDTD